VTTDPAARLRQAATRLHGLPEPNIKALILGGAFTQRLAAWLDLEADVITARTAEDGHSDYAVDITGDHALAVADSILGEVTAP
jgi:hypothetical protein